MCQMEYWTDVSEIFVDLRYPLGVQYVLHTARRLSIHSNNLTQIATYPHIYRGVNAKTDCENKLWM